MIKTVEKFCSEKRLRFGYGFEGGLNDFFRSDANGVYVIIGRPRVGVTEGDIVMRGNAVQYRDELAAMLNRNGNRVSRSDNRLHVVFRIARPMSSGGTGYQPPTPPTPPTPSVTPLYFEAKQANSTVSMMSALTTAPTFEYSEDGETWEEWDSTQQDIGGGMIAWMFDTITLGAIGDKVYFRGTNATLADEQNQQMSVFMPTGNVKVGGSVQSLVDGTGESTTAVCMFSLFGSSLLGGDGTALTEVESGLLPATTLTDFCYGQMFSGCTSLTTAPTLPATTLAKGCYTYMLEDCTSLTTAPTLPATTLAARCYEDMFFGCTSLTTAPTLPATTLADGCYYGMFYGCTSLATAPTLPVTTLANECYGSMFEGCSSLNSVTCLATDISATDCLLDWLTDTAVSGTLYKDPSMTGWVEGTNYPSGWTLTDYAG